ncbi:23S rRNA (guanine(745)-N(1))-methyltransferase [Vibrio thalassae]|uniref:23S rRNA (Guanine(745)-N(1))-methyltransferase n=1 Tax=Vibrio thalassae TaxID=1243014 RepID=A0A240EEB2_9VIBR|nr:23S rRNA (guanine(745)-N(1))-methyltransferase [Vibrio thalassae]SNX47038.1 23S rRNA (guanine(745)-N(1))-methyltransferase [Vibrio thalassae]
MSYQCPLCQQSLSLNERSFRCENNHQFDLAKEGYVNLMPVQHKRSKDPGDNKEMMQARRTFLEHGLYAPMRQQVAETLAELVQQGSVLDIGCGEGYYTSFFQRYLAEHDKPLDFYGLDISKVAIRYGAKRYPNVNFCVASSHKLPFSDSNLAAIIRIYAPCKHDELVRCINERGIMLTVTPGSHHLYELRELIYQDVRLHDETAEQIEGFELLSESKLDYEMSLTGQQAVDLLQMTPFAWKATDDIRSSLKAQTLFHCRADFMIRAYRKM